MHKRAATVVLVGLLGAVCNAAAQPMVQSIVRQTPTTSPTNADSVTWRVTFSEDVSNVNTADFRLIGTTAQRTVTSVSNSVYDVTASGGTLTNLDGLVRLIFSSTQNITAMADSTMALTNTVPTGTNDDSYLVDNTAPTLEITNVPVNWSAGKSPFLTTIEFSEQVTDFAVESITATNATVSEYPGYFPVPGLDPNVYLVWVTPASEADVTLSIAADVASDAAGNGNTAPQSVTSSFVANTPPTVADGIPDQSVMVGTEFNYRVPNNAFADAEGDTLRYSSTLGDGLELPTWLTFNTGTRTFSGTPTTAGTITVRVTATDTVNESVRTTFNITISAPDDTTAPTILSIERQNPATSPTNVDSLTWRVRFSENVQNIDQTDFTLTGTTAALTVTGTASTYDVTASGGNLASFDGTVGIGFASTQNITDESGNVLGITTPTGTNVNNYVVDNTAPSVIIDNVPSTTNASSAPFLVLIEFSEQVTNFAQQDITTVNATLSAFTPLPGGDSWRVQVTPVADGDVTLSIAAEVASDLAGNGNTAAPQVTSTFVMDTPVANRPPMVVNGIVDQTATVGTEFSFVVPADAFMDPDGDTLSYSASQGDGSALPTWLDFTVGTQEFRGTPGASDVGTLMVLVRAIDGQAQFVSTNFNITVIPAVTNPEAPEVVSIVSQTPAASPTNADTLTWRVTFSKVVQNVDQDDFMLVGSTANLMVSPVTAASSYNVIASGGDLAELDGTVILGFAAGQNITDTAATPNALRVTTPSGANDNRYVVDNTAPTVAIDYSPGPGEVLALIQFSEPVTGFEATDITVGSGTPLDFFPIPDENRWVAHYQSVGNAVVTLSIAENVVVDLAGNGNTADSQPTFTDTPTVNTVPTFSAAALTRSVAENAVPGTSVGAPIPAATDADRDVLSYRMLGVDASSFDFNATSRQISTRADIDYDFETRNSYSVQIEAADGNGGTATVAVTIQLTDVDEPPVTPVTPVTPAVLTVANGIGDQTAAAGAAFNFTVPADAFAVTDGTMLSYSATRGDGTALPGWLSFNTATQTFSGTPGAANAGVLMVRVTATNPAGASASTEFDLTVTVQDAATAPTVLSIERQNPADSPTNVDSLTWRVTFSGEVQNVDQMDFTLSGTTAMLVVSPVTASSFDVTAAGGDLAGLDGTVTLGFAPGQNIADTADMPLTATATTPTGTNDNSYMVDNTAPTVTIDYSPGPDEVLVLIQFSEQVTGFTATDITVASGTLLDFFPVPDENLWVAHYRSAGDGVVTLNIAAGVAFDAAGNGNTADSQFPSAETPMAVNTLPTFSDATLTRSVAENAAPGTGVGQPIPAATDADGDALGYRMVGLDAGFFTFNATTRQITTRSGVDYDFEAQAAYSVTIEAADGNGGTAMVPVSISLTDVDEPPTAPAAPSVTATADSTTSLTVSWTAPANAGPPITSYDLRYCQGTAADCTADSDFSNGPQDVTATGTTISGLDAGTSYQVQVRASNAEGDSGWSASGSGSTADTTTIEPGNTAPSATDSTLTAVEDTPYRFTAGDFQFEDPDSGDTLASVRITQLETAGDLQLDGVDVIVDQVIPRADIDANRLTFTPAANANGTGYASFQFRVSDDADESIAAYTMTIDVDAVNDGPTVANGIADRSEAANEAFSFRIMDDAFEDVDGETLTYSAIQGDGTALPAWLDFHARTQRFTGIPGNGDIGTLTVQVTVTDGDGESASDEFVIVITADPVPEVEEPVAQVPVISVADAQVQEGPGATLDFVVSLSSPVPPGRRLSVSYRTSNGTARSGEDYIGLSGGTAYIGPGESSTILSIQVLDDDHDEGSETMTLMIFDPTEGRIETGTATGTIMNSDPMPDAWLSRFGRATADQTAQAIRRRIEGGPRESHLTVGGRRLDTPWTNVAGQALPHSLAGASASAPALLLQAPMAEGWAQQASGATGWHGFDSSVAAGGSGSLFGPALPQSPGRDAAAGAALTTSQPSAAGANRAWSGGGLQLPNARDLLLRSSFFYSQTADGDSDGGLLRRLSTWGEAATTRFNGAEGALNMNGEIATAIMGFDAEWGRWLAGVAVSHSDGVGGYSRTGSEGGTVASALTGVNPYVHYRLNERTSFWATLGYGTGSLTLQPGNAESGHQTSLSNTMAAFGGRGVLSMFDRGRGRFELAVRSDALLTHTASDATLGLADGAGATSRVRMLLEGSGSLPAFGGTLEPRLEAGLRHDAGDAEQGAGFEIGGGLGWSRGPLSLDVGARTLLAHGDGAYEEWGYNAAVEYRPGEDGRGLRLRLGSNWGADRSGVQQLWSQQSAAGLVRSGTRPMQQRFEAEIGYGLGRNRLWYPYAAADSSAGGHALRLGLKLTSGQALEAGLEFGRREQVLGNPPEEAVLLKGRIRF